MDRIKFTIINNEETYIIDCKTSIKIIDICDKVSAQNLYVYSTINAEYYSVNQTIENCGIKFGDVIIL